MHVFCLEGKCTRAKIISINCVHQQTGKGFVPGSANEYILIFFLCKKSLGCDFTKWEFISIFFMNHR